MDARIEELAKIIVEQCEPMRRTYSPGDYWLDTYMIILNHAEGILIAIEEYKQRYPEEY